MSISNQRGRAGSFRRRKRRWLATRALIGSGPSRNVDCANCGRPVTHPIWSDFCPRDQVYFCGSCYPKGTGGPIGWAGHCPFCHGSNSGAPGLILFFSVFLALIVLLVGAATPGVWAGALVFDGILGLIALGGFALYRSRVAAHQSHLTVVRTKYLWTAVVTAPLP